MKKEVQLTLIVNTDDSDREILFDLKTEINHCSNIYEVIDYKIADVKDELNLNMPKTVHDCIKWIEMLKNNTLKPNIVDLTYLNSIEKYLKELSDQEKCKKYD